MSNYISDVNKFKLSGPPQWWLQLLWDFDPSLVVVPSRQGFYYRLAQRRKLSIPEKMVQDAMFNHSDTQMLASYGLVPVTTILATAQWSDWMLKELEERAPWRNGGAEKVIKQLEDREFQQHLDGLKRNDQRMTDYAKFGWRVYQGKTGQRTFINKEKIKAAPDLLKNERPRIVLAS
jgi:hypothetical protein